jgi:thiol-disulfide isomerase/thioredoxin
MPWEPLSSIDEFRTSRERDRFVVVFLTSEDCYLCKLVQPKIQPFADDLDLADVAFCTLDVGVVSIDAEPELQVISSLPVFLLYDSGSLREVFRVTREQRPGRLLARAIKATFDRQG